MPIDGLIKTLIKQKKNVFIRQLNLINISDKLNSIRPSSDNEDRRRGAIGSAAINMILSAGKMLPTISALAS